MGAREGGERKSKVTELQENNERTREKESKPEKEVKT